jgi:hypothetical protein
MTGGDEASYSPQWIRLGMYQPHLRVVYAAADSVRRCQLAWRAPRGMLCSRPLCAPDPEQGKTTREAQTPSVSAAVDGEVTVCARVARQEQVVSAHRQTLRTFGFTRSG